MKEIRVLVVEDNFYTRAGTIAFLQGQPGIVVAGQAVDGRGALAVFETADPDVVVLDLRMPALDGLSVASALRGRARIVMLTQYVGDDDIQQALRAGVQGYLSKESTGEDLLAAIRAVAAGQRYLPPDIRDRLREHHGEIELTRREREVMASIAQGASNREVARLLNISERTVAIYVSSILAKLGAASRTEAVILAARRGLVRINER
jgi:DNA-binding NarL/FixJ family response regulator